MKYNTIHGGDLDSIERELGIKRDEIIDFSGNINPYGVSALVKEQIIKNVDCVSTYPDVGYLKLRRAIGDYVGARPDNIIIGNGSTELIGLAIKAISPKKALIVAPCYSEYEREIKLCGGEVDYFVLKESEDFIPNIDRLKNSIINIDMLIICNPNNPTDSVFTASQLNDIASYCKEKGVYVMIDETYAEFSEDITKITAIPLTEKYDNLIVLRGTSKFFACPGLRLGYGVLSSEGLKDNIASIRDAWSVNSLTAKAGEVMFSDEEHITKTHDFVKKERIRLKSALSSFNELKTYKLNSNLVLCKILKEGLNSGDVFDSLVKYNIIIRSCDNIKFLGNDFFRFCILKPYQNDMLLSGLNKILK